MKDLGKIMWLLQSGLCPNQLDLPYYKQVMLNPERTVQNVAYRDIVGRILNTLVDIVLNDPIIFQKVLQDLGGRSRFSKSMISQPFGEEIKEENNKYKKMVKVVKKCQKKN
jgi:hypothetical protein